MDYIPYNLNQSKMANTSERKQNEINACLSCLYGGR